MAFGTMESVMSSLDAALLDDFDQICRSAHARYRRYSAADLLEHDGRAAAACTYCHMYEEALRRWTDRPGIKALDIRGRKVWHIGSGVLVRLKKTDEDGKARNYPTKQDKEYDRGVTLPGLPEPAVRVTVGYLLNPTQTEIVRVQVSKPRGKEIEWCAAIVPAPVAVGAQRWSDVMRQRSLG
jgi:hypothetical protein